MLVGSIRWLKGSDWFPWLACNILQALQTLAHRNFAGVLFRGVIRAPKKDCEDIGSRYVLLEYAIEHRVTLGLVIERSMDSRTPIGS